MTTAAPAYSPGLEGVIAGESAISRIDLERNRLIIRGYDLVELTQNAAYEELAYLLLHDDLPNHSQFDAFDAQLKAERSLPAAVLDFLRQTPANTHPMTLLRTVVSLLAFYDPEAEDNSRQANVRKTVRLLAKIPTAITAGQRLADGLEPVDPRPDLNQAANLLYMLRGEPAAAYEAKAMNISLILYAEHGYNASAFTARVTASTLSNMHAALTAAIGALAGPLHGGANEKAMEMLLEVGDREKAEQWVLDALAQYQDSYAR